MVKIIDYSDEPRYNIKSVSQKTDLQAVTIRAWERRYALLTPNRAANGYRLYSERDIAVLLWAKSRIDSGVSISSATHELQALAGSDNWPEAVVTDKGPIPARSAEKLAPETVRRQLMQALVRHDEKMSSMVFEDALGSFDLTGLFEVVLVPVLVEIGERWARGEVRVATEHFASSFIQARLLAIFQSLPLRSSAPRLIIGCAPDELHVIGPLMLSILLRDKGYRVEFLGPDVPLDDLAEYVIEEKPKMLILAATMPDSAAMLAALPRRIRRANVELRFGFGGAAFRDDRKLVKKVDGIYLGPTLRESLASIAELIPLRSRTRKQG